MLDSANNNIPSAALGGSMRDFRVLKGENLLDRVDSFFQWQDLRRQNGLWPFSRSTEGGPTAVCAARDDQGNRMEGVNFASQDYLSLSRHPEILTAAKEAIERYGVHSAGSPVLVGNTVDSIALERRIGTFLEMEEVLLYPTGWAAGFGVIKGLVRSSDHIVMDALAHTCLQEVAKAATKNIYQFRHLDLDHCRRWLSAVRAKDTKNAIMVVTEGLFSMDSDTPDLAAMQDLCREYNATLLVDVAHDLGCLGADGRGHIGLQKMLGKVDLVMGSFSKTFASNGGFVACNSVAVKQYLKFYGCSATFSNALSPVQAATVTKAFEIVQSERGRHLRSVLMNRIHQLRDALTTEGLRYMGNPSPIVPVRVGDEALARLVSRRLPALEVIANLVEYPAVAKGDARLRLQLMPTHSLVNVGALASRLRTAIDHAQVEHVRYRAGLTGAAQPSVAIA